MHAQRTSTTSGAPIRALRAFTIVELLVVIGVIGILSLLTTLGARRLTAGSRLASATNAVTSALGNARAAAIKDSAVTGIVFRATYDPAKPQLPQRVELITIRSTGERSIFGTTSIGARMVERYRPVLGIPSTVLPEGIKVGGPMYDPPGSFGSISSELVLATQLEIKSLVNCTESIEFNRSIAILFGADGQFLTRPPRSSIDEMKCYVDWNDNGGLVPPPADPQDVQLGNCKVAREIKRLDWSADANMLTELTGPAGFIAQFGDRITFNRFSGIPERKVR